MSELQKYYVPKDMHAHERAVLCDQTCYAIYIASQADAHIAALKAAHVEELAKMAGDQLARDADMYNLAEENRRLREALQHYSDPKKWTEFEVTCGEIFGGQDGDFAMAFDSPDDCPWSVAAEALNR